MICNCLKIQVKQAMAVISNMNRHLMSPFWLKPALVLGTILFIATVMYASFIRNSPDHLSPQTRVDRWCYSGTEHIDTDRIELLADVLLDQPNNVTDNIFFHDTSCLSDGIVRLNVRQACAIESAARANPTSSVYVLFASPSGFDRTAAAEAVIAALSSGYRNVHWRRLNLTTYAQDTPVARWIHTPALFGSAYLFSHMSDLVRMLSLFRWGGTHLDLDFVVRRAFGNETNFTAEEDVDYVNIAVLNVRRDGVGHRIVARALREFVAHFAGDHFTANGPLLFSKVLLRMCATASLVDCPIFKVHTTDLFYAVHYMQWPLLFEPGAMADAVMAEVNASTAVHMWNKLSAGTPVRLGEGSAYERLALEFCPRVMATVKIGGSF